MTNRVTPAEVKQIVETNLSDAIVEVFITTANSLVNRLSGSCLTDDMRTQIELYLSAHLVTMRDRKAQSERLGDAQITYQGSFGEGLDRTEYGQTARMLDCTGQLPLMGLKAAEFKVF